MSWWSPPPPSSNSEIFVPLPARALTLVTRACRSLFQRRGSGLQEIFRNPDNALGAWMRSRDCKPFETIPPWIRFVSESEFRTREYACHIFQILLFRRVWKKFLFEGISRFFLFLFSSSSSWRPGWKENGGNLRLYSFLFVLSFFLFLRGIIKEKKDYLCKAAHHLFIPSAHVTFRDNTWYRACLNLRISRVYRSALANNRWFYFNISATFLRAAVSSIESPRPTVTNFFDRANISAYIALFAPHKRKEKKKKENLEKNIF